MTLEEALAYAKKEIEFYMYEGSLYHLSKKDFVLKVIYEAYKEQEAILKRVNKVAFETTKHQMELSKEELEKFNEELLDFAWSTNDIIADIKFK